MSERKTKRSYSYRTVLQTLADRYKVNERLLEPLIGLDSSYINTLITRRVYDDILRQYVDTVEQRNSVLRFIRALAESAQERQPDEMANTHLIRRSLFQVVPET